MNKIVLLVGCIVLCELIGITSGLLSGTGDSPWYRSLNKPSFNPPNWIFGPVWTALYACMGVALYFLLQSNHELRTLGLVLFGVQFVLNFVWTPLFFSAHLLLPAFLEIVLLWMTIVATTIVFWRIDPRAAYLLVPYILWVSFAGFLNYTLWRLNS